MGPGNFDTAEYQPLPNWQARTGGTTQPTASAFSAIDAVKRQETAMPHKPEDYRWAQKINRTEEPETAAPEVAGNSVRMRTLPWRQYQPLTNFDLAATDRQQLYLY